jgi:hypothetical protein
LEEGVIHHGALARIQVLGVLEPHQDVQQVAHADAGVGRPVEEAAAGLEEVAGSVDVAAAQVVEIGLSGRSKKRKVSAKNGRVEGSLMTVIHQPIAAASSDWRANGVSSKF